jgi:hypothetical protein
MTAPQGEPILSLDKLLQADSYQDASEKAIRRVATENSFIS